MHRNLRKYISKSSIIIEFLFLLHFIPNHLLVPIYAQTTEKLTPDEIKSLPDELFKQTTAIKYPIAYAYKVTDNSGTYYTLLTEHMYNDTEKNTLIDTIQAFTIKKNNNQYTTQWSLKDFILTDESESYVEASIWFWTKYSHIADIDNDGLCDFIMIYGSNGQSNDLDEGRLKIIIYYKGRKFAAIRHQNSIEDFGRFTTIDSSFYKLPESIQNTTISIISKIEQDDNAVFPNHLYDAFKKKLLSVENDY